MCIFIYFVFLQKLSSLMKLELVKDKTKDEIADIWRQYHSHSDNKAISAVIPADMFKVMSQRFQQHQTVKLLIEESLFLLTVTYTESGTVMLNWDSRYLCHFSTEMAEIWSPGTSFQDVWTCKISALYFLYFQFS